MDWNMLEDLVEEASALPAERREELLLERCPDDAEFRAQALSLLEHLEPGAEYLAALAADVTAPVDLGVGLQANDRIGPYTLREPLGEGGMGTVWLAEQSKPVRRRVALKVIKLGMDTREVVARFESERQALAFMDHPGIARVFDGGMTDGGRPFFVMELVDGVRITDYCDTQRLTTAERVELFIQVCEAVQHAHVKGVLHRDLKPSNVLVTAHEARPFPKVIDFGVAKAISGTLTERTLATGADQMVGTPAYMSPEQADRGGLDVDSRTDVYSLGVMLYELLAGALPFEPDALRRPALLLHLLLGDRVLPPPSARMAALSETQETVAAARGTSVQQLRRQLSGDLDWIVMKAMDRDRDRRYETASGLAQDLRRYLEHQPVTARPPTRVYRLRRFARRNRTAVIGTAATMVALLAGVVGTTLGMVRATEAEAAAQLEAATAEAVSDFLASLFSAQTPAQTLGRELSASELLELGVDRVRTELMGQPLVQAAVLEAIGDVLLRMGRRPEAGPLLEESLAIRERELGPESLEAASTILVLVRNTSAVPLERRRALLERALRVFEREEGPSSIGAMRARQNLAAAYQSSGDYGEAERQLDEAERILRAQPAGVPIPEIEYQTPEALLGRFTGFRAGLRRAEGRTVEALALREEAVALLEASVEPDSPYLASAYRSLAEEYRTSERNFEARDMLERALTSSELVSGPWSEPVAQALVALGRNEQGLGLYDDARRRFETAVAIYDSLYGEGSRESASATWNLGSLALARGDPVAAERAMLSALPAYEADPPHGDLAYLYQNLAVAVERQGRIGEAVAWAQRAVSRSYENGTWTIAASRYTRELLARLLHQSGRVEEASAVHTAATDSITARFGPNSRNLGTHLYVTGTFYRDLGEPLTGLDWLDRGIEVLRSAPDADAREDLIRSLRERASLMAALGRFEEMEAARRELISMHEAAGDPWNLIFDLQLVYHDYAAFGREDDAMPEDARAFELLRAYLAGAKDTTRFQFNLLAAMGQRLGELEVARHAWERQLQLLPVGSDNYLAFMPRQRSFYHEILHEIGDVEAALENFALALEGWESGTRYQRVRFLQAGQEGAQANIDGFRGFMEEYVELLERVGREAEAEAVRRRVERILDDMRRLLPTIR